MKDIFPRNADNHFSTIRDVLRTCVFLSESPGITIITQQCLCRLSTHNFINVGGRVTLVTALLCGVRKKRHKIIHKPLKSANCRLEKHTTFSLSPITYTQRHWLAAFHQYPTKTICLLDLLSLLSINAISSYI